MKAFIYTKYGNPSEVLSLHEVDQPTIGANEVLIAVQATSLNMSDVYLVRGKPLFLRLQAGLPKPKMPILGADVAGEVVAVGAACTRFKVGDAVFGELSGAGRGGLAEFVSTDPRHLAHMPADMTFAQAAALPMAACTALQALRDSGNVQAGQSVLIHGASGGVGSFAVQIAKALGASVTAVCSTRNVERVRALGADDVIDYKTTDFTQAGKQYDLILAVNGNRPMRDYKRALKPHGRCVVCGGSMRQIFSSMLLGSLLTIGSQQSISNMMAQPNSADLDFLAQLFTEGKLTAAIHACYPFEQTVDAMCYLDTGRAQGKVVVQMGALAQTSLPKTE